mmetsp:Transcript_43508/g.97591  ORF Transcript_43508/g.97591 Transcript_43508/m.97591 type:complete len:610 (-) Transcript_43508:29-1858(-)
MDLSTVEGTLRDLRAYLEGQFELQTKILEDLRSRPERHERLLEEMLPSVDSLLKSRSLENMAPSRGMSRGMSMEQPHPAFERARPIDTLGVGEDVEKVVEELNMAQADRAAEVQQQPNEDAKVAMDMIQETAAGPPELEAERSPAESFSMATLKRHLEAKGVQAQNSRGSIFAEASEGTRRLRQCTRSIVDALWFHILVLALIVLNAVLLGVEIDVALTLPEADIPAWFGVTNTIIVVFFVAEIAAKFVAYGCQDFWRGPQAGWNIFDFVIVAFSAIETALDLWAQTLASSMWGSDAFSVVRTLRLARALRGVRFFRLVRHFSALRALILSIVSTMNSLLWTLVLLSILFYSFSVILMQLVTDYCRFLAVESSGDINAVPECPAEVHFFWSNIGRSMLTLFEAITGGISWSDSVRPLESVSLLAVVVMLCYITLSVFTILNVVTGVFVNTAIERASADKEIASLKAFQQRTEQMKKLQYVFKEIDHNNTNELNVHDIQAAFSMEKLEEAFETLGISTDDINTLFSIIDADGSGSIDLEEFVSGCMQLHGPAKSLQLAKVNYDNKRITSALTALTTRVQDLQKKISTLLAIRASPYKLVPLAPEAAVRSI